MLLCSGKGPELFREASSNPEQESELNHPQKAPGAYGGTDLSGVTLCPASLTIPGNPESGTPGSTAWLQALPCIYLTEAHLLFQPNAVY